jgi:GNAT superfamily N-acetyltransferase
MRLVPPTPAMVESALPWFDHPQVAHTLGGRDWLPRMLDVVARGGGEVVRGHLVLRCHAWFGVDAAGEVGFVGGDVYSDGDGRRTMGLAFVVDPRRWREGRGSALLRAATSAPETLDVEEFFCGVPAGNRPAHACCRTAGFVADQGFTDAGLVYHRLRRR